MNLKKFTERISAILISVCFILIAPTPVFAASKTIQESEKGITEIEYLLFSDLVYCDLDDCVGKTVNSIADSDVLKDADRLYFKNSEGKISSAKILKKYVGSWILDKIFDNEESGFFACAFKNDDEKQIIIAFRGTVDAIGKDGLNDAEFGLISVDAPQINDTLNLTKAYIFENSDFSFSSTGHSLGGALATEIAHYYGWKAETFNAAQMTGTLYYDNAETFGAVFHGFDLWNTLDHVNENDFIVGTFEYGQYKNSVKHENRSKSNKFFAHSVNHMIHIDEEKNSISLSDIVSESYITNQKKQIQIMNKYGSAVLGNSMDNLLTTPRIYSGIDVLYGGDGNDYLDSGDNNDTLIGGMGDDILDGSAGNDTYLYYEGDGTDTILDTGGHDNLIIYSDKEITTEESTDYICIYLDNKIIARLDKNTRSDSYSGKPDNAKETDLYYTFTLKQIRSDESKNEFELKSQEKHDIEPITKIVYQGSGSLNLTDGNKSLFDLSANSSAVVKDNISTYCFTDENNTTNYYIYTKNKNIKTNIDGNVNHDNVTVIKSNINDTVSVYKLDSAISDINKTVIDISSDVPKIQADGNNNYSFYEIPYSSSAYLELSKKAIITTAGSEHTLKTFISNDQTDNREINWSSTDETVADIDVNGNITAKNIGQATIIADASNCTAVCRVYVIPDIYAAIIIAIVLILISLVILIIVLIVKHIIRKKKRRLEKVAAK